ncbi:hypothetical protein OROGR_019429 [Orobanche gracilis]
MYLDMINVRRRKKDEALIQSRRGALDKFVVKDDQISSDNQTTVDVNLPQNDDHIDANVDDENMNGDTPLENLNDVPSVPIENFNDVPLETLNVPIENPNDVPTENSNDVPVETIIGSSNNDENSDVNISCDIYDPRYWDGLQESLVNK